MYHDYTIVNEDNMLISEFCHDSRFFIGEELYLHRKNYLICRIVHILYDLKIKIVVREISVDK